MAQAPAVRRRSIRVALAATTIVAAAYFVVAVAVVAFTTRSLTDQVDQRLAQSFQRLPPDGRPPDTGYDPGRDPGRPFGAPFLVWTIQPDGTVLADPTTPELPADLHDVVGPVTATIDGSTMRVAGRSVGGDQVVVAQSLDVVSDAQRTIVIGEAIIAPFLLAIVFLGAVAIGRRVAAPIETARQRQLDFTADASHELRTPLSVIEANTSLALAQERDGAWYRSAFHRVDRESKRMRRLLDDMLWLARFDAGSTPRSHETVDLATLAAQAADRFRPIAETRGLEIVVAVPPAGPSDARIDASPDLVDRLIGVLLDNACKYSPDGGRIDVTVSTDGTRVGLTVDDQGPGIPPDERERIFDRFHRAAVTAGEASGSGLGLAIGDAIVRATDGRWTIGAAPGRGARFSVSWGRAAVR